jgi:hypothetical protein
LILSMSQKEQLTMKVAVVWLVIGHGALGMGH